jgi:hypothetical protein
MGNAMLTRLRRLGAVVPGIAECSSAKTAEPSSIATTVPSVVSDEFAALSRLFLPLLLPPLLPLLLPSLNCLVLSVRAMRYTLHKTLNAETNFPKSTLCLALDNNSESSNSLA